MNRRSSVTGKDAGMRSGVRRIGLLSLAAVLASSSAGLAKGDVVVGGPAAVNDGNRSPFGGPVYPHYQQIYAASAFPATSFTILGLQFFNTQFNSGATQTPAGTFTISLSTSPNTPATLSATFATNIGADNTQVFSGSINQPWAFGNTLTILLTTPFLYNPANGALLLDVTNSGTSTPGGAIFFDQTATSPDVNRVRGPDPTGLFTADRGLVTNFLIDVPEIDGASSSEAVTLAAGMLLLLRGRKARWIGRH